MVEPWHDDKHWRRFEQTMARPAEHKGPSQRQLRVGYNSAARLIERMEKDGKVGAPDHVGRREVLIDPDGNPI